jgi:hypothetical protein
MNETAWNTTLNSSMSMGSSGLITLLIFAGIVAVLIGVVGFGLSNLERYKRIWAILGAMGTSVVYFAYGLCIVVPAVLLYFLIGWLIDISETWHIDPIWIVYIVGGYAGISCIGYVVKRAIDRAKWLQGEMKEVEQDEHR